MKKFSRIACCLLIAAAVLCGVTACGPTVSSDAEYKVTFSGNYSGAPAAQYAMVKANEPVARPSDPTRTDYMFRGWCTDSLGINEYDFSAKVTGNLRLFAKWAQSAATVGFDTGGGTKIDAQTVEVGDKAVRPARDPVKEDHVFEGWYADAGYRTEFDFNTAIEEDTVIYAKWRQTVATVNFIFYGNVTNAVKVDIGGKIIRPAENPERLDYSFVDWYADALCTKLFDFEQYVQSNTAVYAGWKLVNASVTFDPNYTGGEAVIKKTPVGGTITAPAVPEREGWEFVAWCKDKNGSVPFDFEEAIEDNTTLYADWTRGSVSVTFDYNYDGAADKTESVEYESAVTEPTMPARSGYAFIGWYNTAECKEFDFFDFSAPVTDNVTVYAGWMPASSTSFDITYRTNYGDDAVIGTQSVIAGRIVRTENINVPERSGYYFAGWTFDKECTKKVPSKYYASKALNLYAKWLKKYTFEAEYTNLTGKLGQGSSDNGSGPETLCQSIKDVPGNGDKMGISNGWYVGKLYYNGAFLKFEITAAEAVTDATVILRLTPDLYDMYFTPDSYKVLVNDESLNYGSINLSGAIAQDDFDANGNAINGDMHKRPFEDYVLNVPVSLKAGTNVIELRTTNRNDHGGTFNADTPLVDCIYVCADTELSWTNCYPENVGQSMSDVTYDIKV